MDGSKDDKENNSNKNGTLKMVIAISALIANCLSIIYFVDTFRGRIFVVVAHIWGTIVYMEYHSDVAQWRSILVIIFFVVISMGLSILYYNVIYKHKYSKLHAVFFAIIIFIATSILIVLCVYAFSVAYKYIDNAIISKILQYVSIIMLIMLLSGMAQPLEK